MTGVLIGVWSFVGGFAAGAVADLIRLTVRTVRKRRDMRRLVREFEAAMRHPQPGKVMVLPDPDGGRPVGKSRTDRVSPAAPVADAGSRERVVPPATTGGAR